MTRTWRPIPNSYVVPSSGLVAGQYPGAREVGDAREKLSALLDFGIREFIDLTEEGELGRYDALLHQLARERQLHVRHRRFPVRDLGVPMEPGSMEAILEAIDEALAARRTPYLHCWGGIGRTGTVVGCHLVRYGHHPEEALGLVRELAQGMPRVGPRKRRSPETEEQERYVLDWKQPDMPPERSPADPAELSGRYTGALVGLAVGDALGAAVEFKRPGSFTPLTDMVGGGPFNLPAGAWTDDTSMAICLAESLIARQEHDPADQMRRYLSWWRTGEKSSTGSCFDIGNTVRQALQDFARTGQPWPQDPDPKAAGNGSLMRLAPVAMFFADDPYLAIQRAVASSATTHPAQEPVDACRYFAGLLVGALQGMPKGVLLSPGYSPVAGLWEHEPLAPAVAAIAAGCYKGKTAAELPASGYVVHTLEAALWALSTTETFEEGALKAANLGNDADTTGAVYGQLAGAYYGVDGIPAAWRERLFEGERLANLASQLMYGHVNVHVIRRQNAKLDARNRLRESDGDIEAALRHIHEDIREWGWSGPMHLASTLEYTAGLLLASARQEGIGLPRFPQARSSCRP